MVLPNEPPHLVYEATCRVHFNPPISIGAGPFGLRMYYEFVDGIVEGERFNGVISSGGGDWVLIGADGFGRADIRAHIATHDGAYVYMQYSGLIEFTDELVAALEDSTSTGYDDQYLRTIIQFETGDDRYGWLNQALFVGRGRVTEGSGAEYEIFRVT